MFIYNVTIQINAQAEAPWKEWLVQVHIPEVMATGCFTGYRLLLLHDLTHTDQPTYAVQYEAPDRDHYERYLNDHAQRLREASSDAWGTQFTAFRTLMELLPGS